MTFSQFLSILKARWISAAAIIVTLVGLTLVASLLLPKQYTAAAAIVADIKSPDPIAGIVLNAMAAPGYMATQVDIIQSDRVAQKVVHQLNLAANPDLRNQWLESTEGKGDLTAWIARLIQRKLDVKPSRESNVINITYTSPEPKFAATLANAFVRAYIETSVELRVDPAKQYSSFFEAQSKDLREKLEVAQSKLSAYQKEHDILVTDERLDVENQRLNELTTQLVQIQAISAESRSRSSQVRTGVDQLQDVVNNPLIGQLRADLSRQEAKLQETSARYGDAHPAVVELKANITELRNRIDYETKRVGKSVDSSDVINRTREAEVRNAIEAQRTRLLKMRAQRDEVAVLTKDVEAAQKSYDAVTQRMTQSSMESQTNQTNISVLTPATEPSDPSSPKIVRNTALAAFVATLIAIAFAFLREIMDRRVRTVEDVTELVGIPVIGRLPKPVGSKQSRNAFVLPSNVLGRLPSA
jgi:succinoglycan biosynthesis transport protein ExoP